MSHVFRIRHQSLGMLPGSFGQEPTEEQMAKARSVCELSQGKHHPKEKQKPESERTEYWMRIEREPLFGPTDVFELPTPPPIPGEVHGNGGSGIRDVSVSAVGHVEPPKITSADPRDLE